MTTQPSPFVTLPYRGLQTVVDAAKGASLGATMAQQVDNRCMHVERLQWVGHELPATEEAVIAPSVRRAAPADLHAEGEERLPG